MGIYFRISDRFLFLCNCRQPFSICESVFFSVSFSKYPCDVYFFSCIISSLWKWSTFYLVRSSRTGRIVNMRRLSIRPEGTSKRTKYARNKEKQFTRNCSMAVECFTLFFFIFICHRRDGVIDVQLKNKTKELQLGSSKSFSHFYRLHWFSTRLIVWESA